PNAPVHPSPDSVVRELYQRVVARRPLGIPKGEDKAAVWQFLGKKLIQRPDAAQSCEDDYLRQRPDKSGKPAFGWLETGIFGSNERAIPAAAAVERTEPTRVGTFRVNLRLTYVQGVL